VFYICVIKSATKLRKLKPNLELFYLLFNTQAPENSNISSFGRALVKSLRVFEAICSPLGRAVRYNLCCVSLHRGFPLPSLTQKQKTPFR